MKAGTTNAKPAAAIGGREYSAPALDKGLDILEVLSDSEHPLSQRELAHRLGRSVSEIYRMLACLVDRRYVTVSEESNYSLTTRLFELAHRNPPTRRLLVEASPVMERLAGELEQSCHLTVYSSGRQIVLAKVDSPTGMGFSVRVGAELDVLVSASGRVLLAFQDEPTRRLRLEECLQRRPAHADKRIHRMLEKVRTAGFESIASVQVRGLWAVSFPILDTHGMALAALTVPYAERIDQSSRRSVAQLTDALRGAATRLSNRMGGGAPVEEAATPPATVAEHRAR